MKKLAVTTPPVIRAAAICEQTAKVIYERGEQRDQPQGEKTMASTVAAFNTIHGTRLTEVQGWQFMQLLKMVRSAYGKYHADDYVDGVGYAALAAEAAETAHEHKA